MQFTVDIYEIIQANLLLWFCVLPGHRQVLCVSDDRGTQSDSSLDLPAQCLAGCKLAREYYCESCMCVNSIRCWRN